MMNIEHKGREQFLKGRFGSGGDNLFVDAGGVMRRIIDNDMNGDGVFDIALANSHGYIERAPTFIYTEKGGIWEKSQLPHDSCWMPIVADVDGDGYLDLIIANGENGITSELESYIYWGGPHGLTGERTVFNTAGAYDAAVWDLSGNGLKDVLFTTAWVDHHNLGMPLSQKVFEQTSPRQFTDVTEKYRIPGLATLSILCEDLNNDGYPEIVLANYRKEFNSDTDSFVYHGTKDGFDTQNPVRLPTSCAQYVMAADLNEDGFKDLVFSGGDKVIVYWSDKGVFKADNRMVLDIKGRHTMFSLGILPLDAADVDGDGVTELVIGTIEGVEIRKAGSLEKVWKKLPCYGCTGVKAVDVRNTGRIDIIASNYCSLKLYDAESLVFWNSENGYSTDNVTAFETHGPMGCMAADFDNDGIKEIIFCNTMMGPSQWDPELPAFVYYGTPDYQYKAVNRRDYPLKFGSGTSSHTVADVDNDGYVELLVTTAGCVRIFKGTPCGPDPSNYFDLLHPRGVEAVYVGDFNHDGWLDILMTGGMRGAHSEEDLENSTFVFFGGKEGYSSENRMALPSYLEGSMIADVNNDGYVDYLYFNPIEGFVGVYYGGPQGFSRENTGRIYLKDYSMVMSGSIVAADVDNDGWLELFVTTSGHYYRSASYLYVLKDGKNNFPMDKQFMFDTGGTSGYPAFADMYHSGNLDLLLPFYSTTVSRELPARIFRGDGKGNFDWDNPFKIDCLASIAFFPVDLNRNGYPDLFICNHRNDLGHTVNSKLVMNGPDGLDMENAQNLLGYGPHSFVSTFHNTWDRGEKEYYTSPVFECKNPKLLKWQGETPFETSLSFRTRFGSSEEETLKSEWSGSVTENGSTLNAPEGTTHMQYQVAFNAPRLVNSPRLTSVSIECG